jgi:flagellar biogenesis protein FliO
VTDVLQPVTAVILVLSLLGVVLYFLRKHGMASFAAAVSPFGRVRGIRQATPLQLKVVERIPLGAQHALHLVQVGERLILVATSPGSCQLIDSVHEGRRQAKEGAGI